MSRRNGWSLVELMVVIGILVLLAAILAPSLGSARSRARQLGCAVSMHEIHQGLMTYSAINNLRLPPFRFYQYAQPSLPAAGHWGGFSQTGDPWRCGTYSSRDESLLSVGLWTLVDQGSLPAARLICPAAPSETRSGAASMFGYSSKYSTYGVRFPYSQDLFNSAPLLAGSGGRDLLWVYRFRQGGHRFMPGDQDNPSTGPYPQVVPQVHIGRRYRTAPEVAQEVAWGDGSYDVSADTMLADTFWWQDRSAEPEHLEGVTSYPIRSGWSHGDSFNVLAGNGAVRTVTDDPDSQPIRANSHAPGQRLTDTGPCDAISAERIWQFFDIGGRL